MMGEEMGNVEAQQMAAAAAAVGHTRVGDTAVSDTAGIREGDVVGGAEEDRQAAAAAAAGAAAGGAALGDTAVGDPGAAEEAAAVQGPSPSDEGPGRPAEAEALSSWSGQRQDAVGEALRWAWQGYKEFAWGADELHPVSKGKGDWFGLGLTIVDALDTLWLAGEKDEFRLGVEWVRDHLNVEVDKAVNTFETTIRVLGGLLSAYALSGEPVLLERAEVLASKLSNAFTSSPSGVPYSDVNLRSGHAYNPPGVVHSSLSEATTVQLEFKYLSVLTNEPALAHMVDKVMDVVQQSLEVLGWSDDRRGLAPMHISPTDGRFQASSTVSLGARGDSYYEYLLKQFLFDKEGGQRYLGRYQQAVTGIDKSLLRRSSPSSLLYVGEREGGGGRGQPFKFKPKMDHLVCFLPGTLALGWLHGAGEEHLSLAKDLMHTCYQMYSSTAVGLAPEITHFNDQSGGGRTEDMIFKPRDTHNILRPETVESLYYLYWITKDPLYLEWGWAIFESFLRYCKTPTGGFHGLRDVMARDGGAKIDKMETFFLGETLKYFWLLFGQENALPFDEWVLNTEAHPFPVLRPHTAPAVGDTAPAVGDTAAAAVGDTAAAAVV